MEFLGELVGFVRAWLEFMWLELAMLAGFIGLVVFTTRKRQGRGTDATPSNPSAYQDYAAMGGGDFDG